MKCEIKERVISYILSLEREYSKSELHVSIDKNKFCNSSISDIGEKEFISQLSMMETEGLISVYFATGHKDLRGYITIDLYEPILNYFQNKKQRKTQNRNEWIKFWIPISLSMAALIVSIIALIIK